MYSKLISVALIFATALAPTGALVFSRDNNQARGPDPPIGSPTQVSCRGLQVWHVNLAYLAGTPVIYNSQLFTAKEWNYNSPPGPLSTHWTQQACCLAPNSKTAVCTGYPDWSKTTNYVVGATVTYKSGLWIATSGGGSSTPGDASGTWRGLGKC